MNTYKNCQSCGMPLKKEADRGTEKNGEKSSMYCKHCYHEGEFTQKDISLREMEELVKKKCVEMGVPKLFAGLFTRNIKKLKRWN